MSENKLNNVLNLVRLAIVAALYAVMTILIAPLSYGPIQLRFSEMLVLLCFYRKDYAISLTLGCFIANLLSPFGLDILFGTLGTATAVFFMYHTRNVYLAGIIPVITNALFVGFELYLYGEPLWFSVGTVAIGELIAMVIGIVFAKTVLERPQILKLIGSTRNSQ